MPLIALSVLGFDVDPAAIPGIFALLASLLLGWFVTAAVAQADEELTEVRARLDRIEARHGLPPLDTPKD